MGKSNVGLMQPPKLNLFTNTSGTMMLKCSETSVISKFHCKQAFFKVTH